jgi:iron-sulfur cluster assembly protein
MVSVTERAAEKIREYMSEDPDAGVFRLGVRGGGCSGFQYELCFEREPEEDDLRFECHGVTVVVDPASLPVVSGAQVDFADSLRATGFVIENPNVASSCGCGTSFDAREDTAGTAV